MRRPTLAPVVIVLAVLVLPLGGYMGAYYAMLEPTEYWEVARFRPHYRLRWNAVARLLEPAHQIDRRLRPIEWESPSDYGLKNMK